MRATPTVTCFGPQTGATGIDIDGSNSVGFTLGNQSPTSFRVAKASTPGFLSTILAQWRSYKMIIIANAKYTDQEATSIFCEIDGTECFVPIDPRQHRLRRNHASGSSWHTNHCGC